MALRINTVDPLSNYTPEPQIKTVFKTLVSNQMNNSFAMKTIQKNTGSLQLLKKSVSTGEHALATGKTNKSTRNLVKGQRWPMGG